MHLSPTEFHGPDWEALPGPDAAAYCLTADAQWWRYDSLTGKVLIVERDAGLAHGVAATLARGGVPAAWTRCGETALLALAGSVPAAVVIDLEVPCVSGHRLFSVLRRDQLTAEVPVVVLSEDPTPGPALPSAEGSPADAVLERPASAEQVADDVLRLLAVRTRASRPSLMASAA